MTSLTNKDYNVARTYYFADVFTRKVDDRETVDELLDAGFDGNTEVDIVSSNYYTSSKDGMTMGISNRVRDIPKRTPKAPGLQLDKIIVEKGEVFWKVHDFDFTSKLITIINVDSREVKQITIQELQNNFIDPDC